LKLTLDSILLALLNINLGKLNGWLSSQLFKEQFPAHFAEVIGALPLQEYMNPRFGLLNLAANMTEGRAAIHDKGPYVYISYGCADNKAYSVLNLSYDSYDVVRSLSVLYFIS
jgi:[histone H3]-dimethyl-L-lysine9 demethylase